MWRNKTDTKVKQTHQNKTRKPTDHDIPTFNKMHFLVQIVHFQAWDGANGALVVAG